MSFTIEVCSWRSTFGSFPSYAVLFYGGYAHPILTPHVFISVLPGRQGAVGPLNAGYPRRKEAHIPIRLSLSLRVISLKIPMQLFKMHTILGIGLLFVPLALTTPTWADSRGFASPTLPRSNGQTCTVLAHGNETDDTPQILSAFQECNNGGTVVFPEDQNYWIATKLNPVVEDVTVEWRGSWTVRGNSRFFHPAHNGLTDPSLSSQMISIIGAIIHTLSGSRITMPVLS